MPAQAQAAAQAALRFNPSHAEAHILAAETWQRFNGSDPETVKLAQEALSAVMTEAAQASTAPPLSSSLSLEQAWHSRRVHHLSMAATHGHMDAEVVRYAVID